MTAFDTRFPSSDDLRGAARRRIPRFVFEFLDLGCNDNVNLARNVADLREVELLPRYVADRGTPDMRVDLFGHVYDAPFGVAPIGLQGLIWPRAPEILAQAAAAANIPFVLSTCSTASIERIGGLTGGRFWFQLYNPVDPAVRADLVFFETPNGGAVFSTGSISWFGALATATLLTPLGAQEGQDRKSVV